MLSQLPALLLAVPLGGRMDCGDGVPLCGVVTLETGLGPARYQHDAPVVHGLWPEVGQFGSSKCIAPSGSDAPPTTVFPCYAQKGEDPSQLLTFEQHEWGKHGKCAGVRDAADFFGQICELSAAPLRAMASARASSSDLQTIASAVASAGFPVFDTDGQNSQVELSACAGADGKWAFAAVKDMGSVCGRGARAAE